MPEDYFAEARLEFIVERLGEHPVLRDRVYDQLRKEETQVHGNRAKPRA